VDARLRNIHMLMLSHDVSPGRTLTRWLGRGTHVTK
jgi:hypothetical protein